MMIILKHERCSSFIMWELLQSLSQKLIHFPPNNLNVHETLKAAFIFVYGVIIIIHRSLIQSTGGKNFCFRANHSYVEAASINQNNSWRASDLNTPFI